MYIALIVIGAFLVGFLISHFVVIYVIFTRFYKRMSLKKIEKQLRKEQPKEVIDLVESSKKELLDKPHEEINVTSFDKLKLVGDYFNNHSDKVVIMFHGFHASSYYSFAYQALSFLEKGYNVLIVDNRASNRSEGKYSTYGKFEKEDVLSWVNYFKDDKSIKEITLYGISMGASAIMLASERLSQTKVNLLILENGYISHTKMAEHFVTSLHLPGFLFMGPVNFLATHLAKVKKNEIQTDVVMKSNKIPSIFIMNEKDKVVTKENFVNNYDTCSVRKTLINIIDAPHAWSAPYEKEQFINKLFTAIKETK